MAEGSVAAEIYDRHKRSSQPESRQVCAVLGAILEVVAAERLQPTPTTLFAAVMSSLAKGETQETAEVSTSLLFVLSNRVLRRQLCASQYSTRHELYTRLFRIRRFAQRSAPCWQQCWGACQQQFCARSSASPHRSCAASSRSMPLR